MNKTAEYFERLGRRFWFKGDYYKALEILRAGLGLYPRDLKLKLGIAMAQLRLGSYAVARDLLAEVLAASPENGDAHMAFCEASLHLGRKQEALDSARRLAQRHAVSPALLEHLGTLFLRYGMFEEAASFLQKSLAADRKRPYALLGLGIAYKGLGRVPEAVRVLKSACASSRRFYEAISYLGNIIYDQGRQKEAIALFLKIPPTEQLDPVTLTRLIDFCRKTPKLSKKVPAYEARLKEIATAYDINNFIRMLEVRTGKPAAGHKDAVLRLKLLKASPKYLSGSQAERLVRMDGLLKTIFAVRGRAPRGRKLPVPEASRQRESGEFFEEFSSYLRESVSLAERDGARWLLQGGFISLAPYSVALVRASFGRGPESGPGQKAMDLAMDSLIKLTAAVPQDARGAQWLAELGASIIGFWTQADMLERTLLMNEVLPPSVRKAVSPMLARGRAWRRWLGFKADRAWAHPSSQLLPAKAGGRPVPCARCGREIRDYWYIAESGDSASVLCGDCAPVLSCPDCGGPLRQVSSSVGGPVYSCMECRKRHHIARRRR